MEKAKSKNLARDLEDILEKVQLPYDVTQLKKAELGILEEKFNSLSDKDKIKVVRIAEEIFDDRYEIPDFKDGRWYFCLAYGVIEFLQNSQQNLQQNYEKQAYKTASA